MIGPIFGAKTVRNVPDGLEKRSGPIYNIHENCDVLLSKFNIADHSVKVSRARLTIGLTLHAGI